MDPKDAITPGWAAAEEQPTAAAEEPRRDRPVGPASSAEPDVVPAPRPAASGSHVAPVAPWGLAPTPNGGLALDPASALRALRNAGEPWTVPSSERVAALGLLPAPIVVAARRMGIDTLLSLPDLPTELRADATRFLKLIGKVGKDSGALRFAQRGSRPPDGGTEQDEAEERQAEELVAALLEEQGGELLQGLARLADELVLRCWVRPRVTRSSGTGGDADAVALDDVDPSDRMAFFTWATGWRRAAAEPVGDVPVSA